MRPLTNGPTPRAGVVGCGYIADEYVGGLRTAGVEVVACHDLVPARAEAFGLRHGVRPAHQLTEVIDAVDVIVNLTPPAAHASVAESALRHGTPCYVEKPLADSVAAARHLVALSQQLAVPLACAPDTILSSRIEMLRGVIDSGEIGDVVAVHGSVLTPGHERWHPRPGFFYGPGGGPLLDLAPYWLTPLVRMFGPIVAASGYGRRMRSERGTLSGDDEPIAVSPGVWTHGVCLLAFATGPVATLHASFDAPIQSPIALEVIGTAGSVITPDPLHYFTGRLRIKTEPDARWRRLQVPDGPTARGVGVAEFVQACRTGTSPACDAATALHMVEVLCDVESMFIEASPYRA